MTLQEFIVKYNDQPVDTDNAYGAQCMDLMHRYCTDVLNLPLSLFAAPTAYEAYQNANDSRFTKIDNTPTGIPSAGDIIFWNTTIGSAGHVAIFISGDENNFKSFDQNWPVGSNCHEQTHDYNGVAGWLHYNDVSSIIDELRLARDANWNLAQNEIQKNTDLTKQLQEEQTKCQELRKAFDAQTTADADTGAQLLDAQHKADSLQNDLAYIAQVLEVPDYKRDTIVSKIVELQKPLDEQVKPLVKDTHNLQVEYQKLISWFETKKPYKSIFQRIWEWIH